MVIDSPLFIGHPAVEKKKTKQINDITPKKHVKAVFTKYVYSATFLSVSILHFSESCYLLDILQWNISGKSQDWLRSRALIWYQ